MKDETASEEHLLDELDSMYQRVAGMEGNARERTDNSKSAKDNQSSLTQATVQGKIILFPWDKIHMPLQKATDEKPVQKKPPTKKQVRKSAVYTYLMITGVSLVFWAVVLAAGYYIKMPAAAVPSPAQSITVTVPAIKQEMKPAPAVRQPEAMVAAAAIKVEKPTVSGMVKPDDLSNEKFYSIQIKVFDDEESASSFMENLKKKGKEAFLTSMKTPTGDYQYHIYRGYFASHDEASEFFEQRKVSKIYPGSIIKEIKPGDFAEKQK